MTHQQKAGCAFFADKLSEKLIKEFPNNKYYLFDQFIQLNHNSDSFKELPARENVFYPLRGISNSRALEYWKAVEENEILSPPVDILHSNNFQSLKLKKGKLIYTIYDISFWKYPEFTTEANRLNCQQGILGALNNADGFVYISQHARDELHSLLPGVVERRGIKECVVHLGPSHVKTQLNECNGNKKYWLQVGSLEPRKNHVATLDALEIYWKQSQLRLPLKIVGGIGWKSDSLRHRIRNLENAGIVSSLGYLPDSDMPNLYYDAMALIFPSWYEGFGLPIVEAMSHGCPVISSKAGSLLEVGGDAAAYIDPACPEQIAAEMLRIECDPTLWQTMVHKGKNQAHQFSWSKTARQVHEFYENIA